MAKCKVIFLLNASFEDIEKRSDFLRGYCAAAMHGIDDSFIEDIKVEKVEEDSGNKDGHDVN